MLSDFLDFWWVLCGFCRCVWFCIWVFFWGCCSWFFCSVCWVWVWWVVVWVCCFWRWWFSWLVWVWWVVLCVWFEVWVGDWVFWVVWLSCLCWLWWGGGWFCVLYFGDSVDVWCGVGWSGCWLWLVLVCVCVVFGVLCVFFWLWWNVLL